MKRFVVVYFVWITLLKESIGNNPEELRKEINPNNERERNMSNILLRNSLLLHGDIRRQMALLTSMSRVRSNIVCSPLGAVYPLVQLLHGGIRDIITTDELLRATGIIPVQVGTELRRMANIFRNFMSLASISTRLFIIRSYQAPPLERRSNPFFKEISFVDDELIAVKKINDWAKRKTKNKVKSIVTRADISVDSNTNGILATVGYFNVRWLYRFAPGLQLPFYTSHGPKVQLMMGLKHNYMYYNQGDFQLIQIPCLNAAYYLIVLPTRNDGLEDVLSTFRDQPRLLNDMLRRMSMTNLDLSMPTFAIHRQLDLDYALKELGVQSIFHTGFSLHAYSFNTSLIVSKALQRCVLTLNVAGVTGSFNLNLTGPVARQDAPKLNVDHPFLFYIIFQNEQLLAGIYNGDIYDEPFE